MVSILGALNIELGTFLHHSSYFLYHFKIYKIKIIILRFYVAVFFKGITFAEKFSLVTNIPILNLCLSISCFLYSKKINSGIACCFSSVHLAASKQIIKAGDSLLHSRHALAILLISNHL